METVVAIVPHEQFNLSSTYSTMGHTELLRNDLNNGSSGVYTLNTNYSLWTAHKTNPPEYAQYSTSGSVALQVLAVLIVMTTAVFGNLLMCYAVYRTPSLRTMANLFTINLAISDLSLAIAVLPAWMDALVSGSTNARGSPPFSEGLCHGVAFVTVLLLLVSIATLAGTSLDRYFIICHPLRYPMEITARRVCSVLVYIWAQSTLLAATPYMGWGVYTYRPQTISICNPAWGAAPGHAVFLILVGMAVPFSIMVFSYTRIVQAARRQWARIAEIQRQLAHSGSRSSYGGNGNAGSSSDEEDPTDVADVGGRGFRSRPSIFRRLLTRKGSTASLSQSYSNIAKNLRTLKTIFIVVGVFFVCWGPYVVVQVWAANNPDRPLPYLADLFTTLLAFSNSAINPFMFMLLNRDFRYALRLMLARLSQFMGEEEAVHKAKMKGHRDSMGPESFRLHSRASVDSGVVMEMKPTMTSSSDSVLRPPPAPRPPSPRDRMPDHYLQQGAIISAANATSSITAASVASTSGHGTPFNRDDIESGDPHRCLLDAPIPHSYQSCEHGRRVLQPTLLTVPSICEEDIIDIRQSLNQEEPEGPTFIVPNGNIPIIVIGGAENTW